MTMLAGSSPIPMIVSEVWNATPDSAITGGTVGRAPVATTIRSAVMCVRSSMTSSRGPREAGPALEQRHPVRVRAALAALGGDLPGVREDPVLDGLPVHAGQLGAEAEPGRAADPGGDIGGVHEDLAGNAAPVEAGPAERA